MLLPKEWHIHRLLAFVASFLLSHSISDAQVWFRNNISISTNLIDWGLITPNIGLDIPISDPSYIDASSIYFEGKASLKANQTYIPHLTYNLNSLKVEYRKHFRFGEESYKCSTLTNFANKIAQIVTRKEYWRERKLNHVDDKGRSYIGLFAQHINYSLYIPINNNKSFKGKATIAGLSIGYNKPFYNFNNMHYLEWEFGTSIGAVFNSYNSYAYQESTIIDDRIRFYPMITDLHISLIYRRNSISKMYKRTKSSDY